MNTVKLYYPSMTQDNKPIDQSISNPIYKQLCQDICKISGGLTVYPVTGMYVNRFGQLINDDISLIVAYSDKLNELIDCMHTNAMIILKALDQESVLIEVNDKLEFITD